MIKVLIVEDSPTVSQYLEYLLGNDPEIEVIGNLSNGKQAVEFVKKNKPDVITMDIDMPVMNGFEATRRIMSTTPVPIIIVTASRNAHKLNISIEALAAGALTVIQKPVGLNHPNEVEKTTKMISLIKIYSQVKVIKRRFLQKTESVLNIPVGHKIHKRTPNVSELLGKKYVAIGISSGGPEVLKAIFSKLSNRFPYPILVVQHITEGFLESMVSWLSKYSGVPVKIASDKDLLLPGTIYFAPDKYQMGVNFNRIELLKYKNGMKICPSVEHLFNSLVLNQGDKTIALLLTGMGNDGAKELKKIVDAGGVTIAQDRESSLVHGMPGEAIKINGARYILNIDQIIDVFMKIENNWSKNLNRIS